MGKSRAEIQKAYRQRLKEKNNDEYLKRERERMRSNYVASSALSDNDRKKRNEKNRQKLKRFYNRKKLERSRNQAAELETSGYESEQAGASEERGRLRVRLNFETNGNKRKGALRRWKREMSEANSRIRQLEQERHSLRKKVRATQRNLQREKKKQSSNEVQMTPRKETMTIMNSAKLSSSQKEKLRKTLLLGHVVLHEVRESKKATAIGQRKALHRVVSGKIVKKYRCASFLSQKTGLCRHKLAKSHSKNHQLIKSTRISSTKRHQKLVEEFLTREDNSRTQPGKNDAKRIKKGEKIQTHVLTDYLSNLYQKFKSENPNIKLSFTSFCRCRPKYILTVSFSSRSACLCTKHQNAALTIKTIKRECPDMSISANPETFIKSMPKFEVIRENLGEIVVLNQWTRIEVEEKGKKKFITRIVESTLDKDKFISHLVTQMGEFESHVNRVKIQYEQIRELKQKLPDHEMIVQVDFAENYSCKSLQEVQSAYFNQTCVTLHPMVIYYKSEDDSIMHKSFIIVSDEMAHKASTVLTFIDEMIPELKKIDNEVKTIHYWSDSPTSQYRNKYIFDLVANHEETYGLKARWNYFEAGHGKGPCDGLGGTCKRLADEAMRSGKTVIQDANAFYEWAVNSSMTNVKFVFVSTKQCAEKEHMQEKKLIKSIKGTMKVHAVVGQGESNIRIRDVSCYCAVCLSGDTCDSWRSESTTCIKAKGNESTQSSIKPKGNESTQSSIKPKGNESTQSSIKPKGNESTQSSIKPKGIESTQSSIKPKGNESTQSSIKPKGNESTQSSIKPKKKERTKSSIESKDKENAKFQIEKTKIKSTKSNIKTNESTKSNESTEPNTRPIEIENAKSNGKGCESVNPTNNSDELDQTEITISVDYHINDYVAAIYENNWYIGIVLNTDEVECELEIDFMEPKKLLFQWPRRHDKLWIDVTSVLCKVNPPESTGKSQRMFKLNETEKQKIIQLYSEFSK